MQTPPKDKRTMFNVKRNPVHFNFLKSRKLTELHCKFGDKYNILIIQKSGYEN